jgi:hypothetical protein
MIQLFIIIAFVLGFALGWKVYELVIANGLAYLATQNNSGVRMDENTNKITIDAEVLQNFSINKENNK